MSKYLNLSTNEYPRHIGDLEIAGWSKNDPLPENWVKVNDTDPPSVAEGQIAVEIIPKLINGSWVQQWEIHTFTKEELDFFESQKEKKPWEKL